VGEKPLKNSVMVWRDNIKVLGIKAKASPLLISMLLHMVVLSVFAVMDHEKERIFTVELMMQEVNGHVVLKTKPERKMPVTGSKAIKAGNLEQQPAAVIDRHEGVVRQADEIRKRDDVVLQSIPTPHPIPLPQGERELKNSPPLTGGDKGEGGRLIAISAKGITPSVVEAELGSSNGPSFLKTIKPEYPRLARRLGREGKVVLRLFIDEHGRLLKVEVIEKAGHGFDEAAVEAVKASTFRSAKMNGMPVACKAVLPVRFRLE
jgi:TonB family protein